MLKAKIQKNVMSNSHHGKINAFFSPKVRAMSMKSASLNSEETADCMKDWENLCSSPDPNVVPETPDSLIKPRKPSGLLTDASRSPVCRSPQSKGFGVRGKLVVRMPMKPLKNEGPSAMDPSYPQREHAHGGSVKRRMLSPEDGQKSKRLRPLSVKRPRKELVMDSELSCAKSLSECLEEVRRSSGVLAKTKRSDIKCPQQPDWSGQSGRNFTRITDLKSDDILQDLHDSELVVSCKCETDAAQASSSCLKNRSQGEEECQGPDRGPDWIEPFSVEDELDDCWFDDKMEPNFTEAKPKQSVKTKRIPDHVMLATGIHNRYWVLDVQEKVGPKGYLEKLLILTSSKTSEPTEKCILQDDWVSTPVSVGDVVHLEGKCVAGTWVMNRDFGFLVLLPDLLISGTSIASSIRCMRRAVLGEMFKNFEGGSKHMLNGTIVHEIFQKAALSMDFSQEKLEQLASNALHSPNYLGQMYTLNLTQEAMKDEMGEYLTSLSDWARDYLNTSPHAGNKQMTLKLPSDGPMNRQDSVCTVTVNDFVDIEENIWSPRFGLKGKIDVTAGVRIHRRDRSHVDKVVPLELKTGKESNSIEHRSQVILYTLMGLERRCDAETGFLLYLKTGNLHPVVGNHMDRRELLKLRNLLAHHLGNNLEKVEGGTTRLAPLPAVIFDSQACKFCPQMRNCALYNKAMERVPVAHSSSAEPQPPFLEQESQHLNQLHLQYFSRWLLLCTLEARTMENKGSRRNIWLQSAQDREKSGSCMANMKRTGEVAALADDVFLHHFKRQGGIQALTGLIVGDRVVVSGQDVRLIGVAAGYVTEMTSDAVTCSLDRDLSKYPASVVFRLDQDEGAGGLSTHVGNLSKLMENSPTSQRLRELIVEFRAPQFIDSLSSVLPRNAKDTVANILKGLNKPQKQAMKKVLLSKDYTLIVGMPGTGKTTTICTLVRILHACGFSVLLTSYTHSAVDNILLKLKKFKIGFLRLGRAQKVHPDVLPFTEEQCRAKGLKTLAELEHLYSKELVVATTCMGVKHPIFTRRHFDFCIVDEASQISQPVCLGPLFYAQRFVLVGDHQQLPPIVQNAEARTLGMDESLFKRLERHSSAVVQLNVQYRMNSKIMSLSNTLMYEGKLECGSERTASAVLQLPSQASVERELELCVGQEEYSAWIHAALDPLNSVCFLDTSKVPAIETVEKGGISNHTEAVLVHAVVSLLVKAGCKAVDIGVIAPYRQQLKAISGLLEAPAYRSVEVNTVDKYQGRDKSVIIVSFVRSNMEANLGELLKDWRRLNVAITRAKHKLLMIGSSTALRLYSPLLKLLTHLEQENMISFLLLLLLLW
ncbi:DNA replication ATP-dependent helicase/nuclease DNA2 [Denticeps clupeoides]|uniref:DNA replication ATP-dependent helicase/nuclease DNA2 n=1 Tax=Denticeps clupeoides TaxID=299321 RepID=UPI0010A37230|nr:DNA replication ATP-dependent helicase/nuclease DNA2 [Denticeps clupeoides]